MIREDRSTMKNNYAIILDEEQRIYCNLQLNDAFDVFPKRDLLLNRL